MWTSKNRGRYDRSRLRYPSDLTDEEWALVEPLIAPAKRGGNRRHVVVREVVNGLMYILSTGCQWRAIAKDLPPRSTLYDYFDLWGWDGTLDRIHDALYAQCRQAAAREASPTAAIIDSQSVKSAEKGGLRLIRRATMQAKRSPDLLAFPRPGAEPGREHLAVSPPELALKHRLRKLRRNHRRRMRRLAKTHRSTRNDHLHRNARLARRSAAMTLSKIGTAIESVIRS